MLSLIGVPASAAASPDSSLAVAASPEIELSIIGIPPPDFSGTDSLRSLILDPGVTSGPADIGGRNGRARRGPVPPPPPFAGKSTPWIFAGAIAAAFVSFVIIAAFASTGS
jgi:hypothetical protein